MQIYNLQKAISTFKAGDLDECRRICDYLINVNENNPDVIYLLAQVEINQRNYGNAISLLKRVIDLNFENAQCRFTLGSVYLNIKQLNKALDQFEIAVNIDPSIAEAWNLICGISGQLGLLEDSIKAGKKAIKLQPNFLGAQMNLATAYDSYGLCSDALKHFKISARIAPRNPVVLCKMGDALIGAGDKKSAERYYRKAITAQQNYTHSYRQISRLNTYSTTKHNDFIKINQLIHNNTIPESECGNLHFALGKMYEDCKMYDDSFYHLEMANKIERRKRQFSEELFIENCSNIISFYKDSLFQDNQLEGNSSDTPIFIVGMPRSGSTLTEQIIACHSECYGAGELYWFGQIEYKIKNELDGTSPYPDCLKYLSDSNIDRLAQEYLRYINRLSDKQEYQRITDKLPGNFLHLGLISLMFPNAHIINCRRNPLDTCFSIYSILFPGNIDFGYDLHNIAVVYNQYERLMRHWEKVMPGRILTVDYEDIVFNQEETSKRMIEFIGLHWEDACLNVSKSKNRVKTVSAFQVKQGLYASAIGRWKNFEKHLDPLINTLDPEILERASIT